MKFPALTLFLLIGMTSRGAIIESTNRMIWSVGTNVGVIGGIPTRTGTTIDVTADPYFADKTGVTNSAAAINSAIAAAVSNDIVYLPTGLYWFSNSTVSIDKSGVLLKGAGMSNTVIVGSLTIGHSSSGNYAFNITSGGTVGSTNLSVAVITNQFGDAIAAGDVFSISQVEDDTNEVFQVFSVTGYTRNLAQVIRVDSVSGTNLTLSTPLLRNYTNSGQIRSLNLQGASSLRFKEGIGANGIVSLGFSATDSEPTSGDNFVTITNHTATDNANQIEHLAGIYDDVETSDGVIP